MKSDRVKNGRIKRGGVNAVKKHKMKKSNLGSGKKYYGVYDGKRFINQFRAIDKNDAEIETILQEFGDFRTDEHAEKMHAKLFHAVVSMNAFQRKQQ